MVPTAVSGTPGRCLPRLAAQVLNRFRQPVQGGGDQDAFRFAPLGPIQPFLGGVQVNVGSRPRHCDLRSLSRVVQPQPSPVPRSMTFAAISNHDVAGRSAEQ